MKITSYLMLLSSLWLLFSCFKCTSSKEEENIFNDDFARVDTAIQHSSKEQENIFNEVLKDSFFQTYLDKGRINFSVHYFDDESLCHGLHKKINCTVNKINKENKYVELTEFIEVKGTIRIQVECHLPNDSDKVYKIYSCSYDRYRGGYKLRRKHIDLVDLR